MNKIVTRLSYIHNRISYTDATMCLYWNTPQLVNCLHIEAETNGHHFPDYIFKWISLNENCCILIKISLKYVHQGPINIIPPLV